MGYIVDIQTGSRSRGNFSRSKSILLPNKIRVRNWVKRNPIGNIRTPITIKDTKTNKTIKTTKAGGSIFGWNIDKEIKRRKN